MLVVYGRGVDVSELTSGSTQICGRVRKHSGYSADRSSLVRTSEPSAIQADWLYFSGATSAVKAVEVLLQLPQLQPEQLNKDNRTLSV